MTGNERVELGKKRLKSILGKQVVCVMRTLEQKISDSGPNDQRIDPHILTEARQSLTEEGVIAVLKRNDIHWYYLRDTEDSAIARRLEVLGPLHDAISDGNFTRRVGQALEIAVFKALGTQRECEFVGAFVDLDAHTDAFEYRQEPPPKVISGRSMPGETRLDFAVVEPEGGWAGIEVKNVREWMYPGQAAVRDLLWKCCAIDAVPVLIARRIPYGTFSVLHKCGVLIHQVYNQRYPNSEASLARRVRDRDTLGFHDIQVGNEPDGRLIKFIHVNLPQLIPSARKRFHRYVDLLSAYGNGTIAYEEFAGRARRRDQGAPEDHDWELAE